MKRIRDPVHGFVELPRKSVLPLVDTFEFQRLRRLTQLGTSSFTYPGAEHSRFQHSLGVAHLFIKLAQELQLQDSGLTEEQFLVGACAALLHDIGHSPFSHALEGVVGGDKDHEDWTQEIILSPETDVNRRLRDIDEAMPQKVADIIGKRPPNSILVSMISSQMDVDRMDYLLRDSISVGVPYGRYDVDRLLKMLRRDDNRLVVDERGEMNAQEFLFARYYMYWQVYFHATTRGFEQLLKTVWKRAMELAKEGALPEDRLSPFLKEIFHQDGKEVTIRQYIELDNHDIYIALKTWAHCDDKVLADLSRRLLRRNLLKPIDVTDVGQGLFRRKQEIQDLISKADFDPEYYLLFDALSAVPYDYYTGDEEPEDKQEILVLGRDGRTYEISRKVAAISAIARRPEAKMRIYVPAECRERIEALLM